jgi:uncharacterized protein (TIGR02246 family)
MRYRVLLFQAFLGLTLSVSLGGHYKAAGQQLGATNATQPAAHEVAIRQAAKTFTEDFNRGDAQAVAAHWTSDGDYINEVGQQFHGRDAIQQEYETFFANNPGVKINLVIDSIRQLTSDTAIEDGRAAIGPFPAGPPAFSRYTVVHVRQNGKWLVASTRDTRMETPPDYPYLRDLEWLIGIWKAENEGVHVEANCRWIAGQKFMERKFVVREGETEGHSGTQIIGWDPASRRVTSWLFDSSGGRAVGVWTPHETGWLVETKGVLSDGTPTTATNYFTRLEDHSLGWRSIKRSAGNSLMPNTNEIVLKRQK